MEKKPILCLDFDGVLHSYTSGWKGARNIPDPPVEGAMEFLNKAIVHFQVCILSSRSHQWGGRRAMKKWLLSHLVEHFWEAVAETDSWTILDVHEEYRDFGQNILSQISFPKHKPPAQITIDDRALTFTGRWPKVKELLSFKPWNKRDI